MMGAGEVGRGGVRGGVGSEGYTRSWLTAPCPSQEEEKLHTLAMSNSLSTSSNGSLSSGVTSGYNSSTALPDQLQSPDSVVSRQMLAMSQGPEPLRQELGQEILPLGCRC